jgi:ribosome maturation factor RimP
MTQQRSMTQQHRAPAVALDRDKFDALVAPIASAHGAEVFDVEFKSEGQGWVLRVLVEKQGSAKGHLSTQDAAISLDVCSNIARDLSPALDVHDFIPHRYHLEVGSPGVERNLKNWSDFVRFSGSKAKLRLHAAVGGQKVLVGTLRVDGSSRTETLVVEEGKRTSETTLPNVVSAHLVFEYAPQKKPTSGKSALSKSSKAAKPT